MAKSAMPVSKAKTAYGLLGEVRQIILDEPKRYDQSCWLMNDDDIFRFKYGDAVEENIPACGTVGCVAGWVVALKRRRTGHIGIDAAEILGLTDMQRRSFFRPNAGGQRDKLGAERHARRGAEH